jgi:hypothetical protein
MTADGVPTRRHVRLKDMQVDDHFATDISHDTTLLFRLVIAIAGLVSILIFLPTLLAWAGYEGAIHHMKRKSSRSARY